MLCGDFDDDFFEGFHGFAVFNVRDDLWAADFEFVACLLQHSRGCRVPCKDSGVQARQGEVGKGPIR